MKQDMLNSQIHVTSQVVKYLKVSITYLKPLLHPTQLMVFKIGLMNVCAVEVTLAFS